MGRKELVGGLFLLAAVAASAQSRLSDKPKAKADVPAENAERLQGFQSVGMQHLVDVIRKTGARNLVTAGGLDWGYDLFGVLKGFALVERGGNGIIYETHVYPWKNHWQTKFLDAAARYPVLVGEVGCQPKPMPFENPRSFQPPETWAPDVLGCIQKYRLNWTAWCFHPSASPCLLADWSYAPTPYWGVPVKAALAGQAFELKRLRWAAAVGKRVVSCQHPRGRADARPSCIRRVAAGDTPETLCYATFNPCVNGGRCLRSET